MMEKTYNTALYWIYVRFLKLIMISSNYTYMLHVISFDTERISFMHEIKLHSII